MLAVNGRWLRELSVRLGRLDRPPRSRAWREAAILLAGSALAGGFGLLAFLASDPSSTALTLYVAALGACVLTSILCGLSAKSTSEERADSVGDIRRALDDLLADYDGG